MRRREFSRLPPPGTFKCPAVLQIAILSAIIFQVPLWGRAQENLVDLYNWSNDTGYVPDPSSFITIDSFDSVYFYSGFTTNPLNEGPQVVQPILSGMLATTPGETYDVSFTMQLGAPSDAFGGASMSFGDFVTNCDLQNPAHGDSPGYNPPMSFDFALVATSPATPMAFYADFGDYTDGLSISDAIVTEAPEASTTRLFWCGGCTWLLFRFLRRLLQRRTLALLKVVRRNPAAGRRAV